MGRVARQDFVKYHLRQAVRAARAELDGDEDLSRRLHAETKLRLMCMADEDLWELDKLISCPPERPVELVYKGIKGDIEEHRATIHEWINDLGERTEQGGKDDG